MSGAFGGFIFGVSPFGGGPANPSLPTIPQEDYVQMMANLLPRGAVWSRDSTSQLMKVIGALAPTYARARNDAIGLINDIFPATTQAMLTDWEDSLGLPDECTPLNPSTEKRRAAVLAKFISTGGQSVPYFTAVALAMGYVITVTEFTQFRVGFNRVGQPLNGPDAAYHWQVNAPTITETWFRVGLSTSGDPLYSVGNTELECRLNKIKPAHTVLSFVYS